MLDALDKTLELLLSQEFPSDVPSDETKVFISFDTPYQGAIKEKPAINCFLYDVQENLELRRGTWSVERQNGKAIKKRPPARVDCSYLITVLVNSGKLWGEGMELNPRLCCFVRLLFPFLWMRLEKKRDWSVFISQR